MMVPFAAALKAAYANYEAARTNLRAIKDAVHAYLSGEPPKTARLQEARKNPDGSFDTPHWDEVLDWRTQNAIDPEELRDHVINESEWTKMFDSTEDDPRPGYRRVIDVRWA